MKLLKNNSPELSEPVNSLVMREANALVPGPLFTVPLKSCSTAMMLSASASANTVVLSQASIWNSVIDTRLVTPVVLVRL